ncbi:MAG TPA: CBS domain-containing protein [Polyangiaceae bacterium]|jgi:CBS domain-containing protein
MKLEQLTAGSIMVADVVTVGRHETVRRAAAIMTQHKIHCLVVLPEDPRRALGVVTMKDVVQVLCEGDSHVVDRLRVADVLSEPAICVQRDAALLDCLRLMRNSGVRSAPVLHATTPVGLLSFTDVVRALATDAS